MTRHIGLITDREHAASTATLDGPPPRPVSIEAVATSRSSTLMTTVRRSPDTMAQREVDVKRRRAYVILLTWI
jgi:hypothetical protein